MFELYALVKCRTGFEQDEDGRNGDHRAFEHRGEKFRFVVAERVIGIGGLGADENGGERGNRRHHVDDAFEGVGEERNRPRRNVSNIFDGDDNQSDCDICHCNLKKLRVVEFECCRHADCISEVPMA